MELLDAGLEHFLGRVMYKTGLPGMCVTISSASVSATVHLGTDSKGSASLTSGSLFDLGCMSEMLLGIVTLELIISGALALGAPIGRYLPELPDPVKSVPLHALLAHTSGYRLAVSPGTGPAAYDASDLPHLLRGATLLFRPGSVFNYHQWDTVLLREIVRRSTGRSVIENIREVVLAPLGLLLVANTSRPSDDLRIEGGALLAIPALAKIGVALASARDPVEGCAAWNPGVLSLLTRHMVDVPRITQHLWEPQLPVGYGLGCARYADGSYGHPGSATGQCCALRFDPVSKAVVAVGIHARNPGLRDGIVTCIMRRLTSRAAMETSLADSTSAPLGAGEIVGSYVSATEHFSIHVAGESGRFALTLASSDPGYCRTFRFSLDREGAHRIGRWPAQLTFFRDPGTGSPCLMYGMRAFKRL